MRESHDRVAGDYVERVPPPEELNRLSRAMPAGFAELVRTAGPGRVADLGCGPGRVTAHLAALGEPAFGVDLSPEMVGPTRRAHPDLRFAEGSMDRTAGLLGQAGFAVTAKLEQEPGGRANTAHACLPARKPEAS